MIRPERVLEGLDTADDVDYVLVTNTPHGIKGRKDVMDEVLKLFPMMEQAKKAEKAGHQARGLLADRLIFMDPVPQDERRKLIGLAAAIDAHSNTLGG